MNAAKRGDITWHAGPMNMQYEVMDVSLARFGIQLSKELDDRMNINRKFRTLSQRDVPGKILSNIFYLYFLFFCPIVHQTNKTYKPPLITIQIFFIFCLSYPKFPTIHLKYLCTTYSFYSFTMFQHTCRY